MLIGLIAQPTAWFLAGLVVIWVGVFLCYRTHMAFPAWATAGLIAYVVSYFLANLWRLGDGIEGQISAWQAGLGFTGIMYAVIFLILCPPARNVALTAGVLAGLVGAATLLVPHENVVAQKLAEFGQLTLILLFCLICLVLTRELIDRLVWGVLSVAEGFAAIEYLDCQLLHRASAPRIEGSSCSQIYGDLAPFAAPTITTAVLLWLLYRWWQAHGRTA